MPDTTSKAALILGVTALVLAVVATAIRLYRGHGVDYFHLIFMVGLFALIVSQARQRRDRK